MDRKPLEFLDFDWSRVLGLGAAYAYMPGAVLTREHTTASDVYFLECGHVILSVQGQKGRVHLIDWLGHHRWVGNECLGACEPAQFTAVVRTPARVHCIPVPTWQAFVENNLEFTRELMRYGSLCWLQLLMNPMRLSQDPRERLKRVLLRLLMEQQGHSLQPQSPLHEFSPTDDELAEFVGRVTPQEIAEYMGELEKAGIACRERGVLIIVDPQRLSSMPAKAFAARRFSCS